MTPEDFAKAFAATFGRHDAAALAALLAEDAEVLTLTGAAVTGAKAAEAAFAAEFAGTFAASRLVTGKLRMRELGGEVSVVSQRFVVSGARDEARSELPRIGALLTAVLVADAGSWRAVNLTFSATA
jgi:ketosteroid isomerase-like protein